MDRFKRCGEIFAGLSGFFGVAFGALAAHKAKDLYAAELLREASLYQLVHSVAMLSIIGRREWSLKVACGFFASGIFLFCGGFALKALSGIIIGSAIPFGGGCLMLGWLAVATAAFIPGKSQAT